MISSLPATLLPPLRGLMCHPAAAAALWAGGHGDIVLRDTPGPHPAFSCQRIAGTGGTPAVVDGTDVYDSIYSSADLRTVVSATRVSSPNAALSGAGLLHLVLRDGTDAALHGEPFEGSTNALVLGLAPVFFQQSHRS